MLEVRRTLHVLDANDDATAALDRAVRQNLKDTADRFPMGDVERQVANQVSERVIAQLGVLLLVLLFLFT